MGPDELATYVEHARGALPESGALGLRNTQLRLVEPFLECLGWDVRSPAVEAAYAVQGSDDPVDYALLVDGEPVVFVDTLACESSLDPAQGDVLLSTMGTAGVEWGILTNGRRFAFVARHEAGEDGFTCSLPELPDHAADLERFTPERAGEYVSDRERRAAAAAAIADRRDALADLVLGELRSLAGEDADAVPWAALRSDTESFVDELVTTVAPDGQVPTAGQQAADDRAGGATVDPAEPEPPADDADDGPAESVLGTTDLESSTASSELGSNEGGPAATRDESRDADREVDSADQDADGEVDHDVDGAERASMTDDGEYVVRLFKDRNSIGAVGGSSVAGTMKETADYLLAQHHLDAGLSLPYVPDDGGYAVLHRVPRHPNGEPMAEYVRLDAGPYLWADGTIEQRRQRIETLARAAGLRVMFQGDWKPSR